jgi:hypothetical protein
LIHVFKLHQTPLVSAIEEKPLGARTVSCISILNARGNVGSLHVAGRVVTELPLQFCTSTQGDISLVIRCVMLLEVTPDQKVHYEQTHARNCSTVTIMLA